MLESSLASRLDLKYLNVRATREVATASHNFSHCCVYKESISHGDWDVLESIDEDFVNCCLYHTGHLRSMKCFIAEDIYSSFESGECVHSCGFGF